MSRVDLSTFTSAGADEATYLTDNTDYRTLASALPLAKIAYRYKAESIAGDFTHHIEYRPEIVGATSQVFPYMLADNVGDGYRAISKLVGSDDSGDTTNVGANIATWSKWTCAATGVLTHIRILCGASGNAKVAIYADNAGTPAARLGKKDASTAVVAGWNSIALEASVAVTASTVYWLCANVDTAACLRYKATGVAKYVAGTYGTWTWADPAPALSDSTVYVFLQGYGIPATDHYLAVRQVGTALDIAECYKSTTILHSSDYTITQGDIYYLEFKRATLAVTLKIYSAPEKVAGNLLSTLTLNQTEAVTYDYVYVMNSYNSGSAQPFTGWTGNLWLSGTPPTMFTESMTSFIIDPDYTDTFETGLDDAETLSGSGEISWTVAGTAVADTGDAATLLRGGTTAHISCSAGVSNAHFDLPGGSQTKNFQMLGWFYVDSCSASNMAPLMSIWKDASHWVQACVYNNAGSYEWRIERYVNDGAPVYTNSAEQVTLSIDTWYQVLFFQDQYHQMSMWIQGTTSEWVEVATLDGIDNTWLAFYVGGLFASTSEVYVDDFKYQAGTRTISQIARGGAGDNTVLVTSFLNKDGTYTGDLYYSTAVTRNPSCWTKLCDLETDTDVNTGQLIWDKANNCWWEFQTITTGDNVGDVYEITAALVRTKRGTYSGKTDLGYIIPSRDIESGEILCTMLSGSTAHIDLNFIKFDTGDYSFSEPVFMADGADIAGLNPYEAFLWRQPTGDKDLVCIERWGNINDDPVHSDPDSTIAEAIQISTDDGATWSAVPTEGTGGTGWPGGDQGKGMYGIAGWFNAFSFRNQLWYQGYDSRTASSLGPTTTRNYKSMVAMADSTDGAIITQRNWGWGPSHVYDKSFCFISGNGNVDAQDGQPGGETFKLDVVTNRGIGWYLKVSTGLNAAERKPLMLSNF